MMHTAGIRRTGRSGPVSQEPAMKNPVGGPSRGAFSENPEFDGHHLAGRDSAVEGREPETAGRVERPARGAFSENSESDGHHLGTDFRYERPFAWSYDGGETWRDLGFSRVLPDGPRYRREEGRGANFNGHFGMMCGLVRLPIENEDILIYSNADTPSHGSIWHGSLKENRLRTPKKNRLSRCAA